MLNKIAKEGVIYFAYNKKISVCEHNHGFIGTKCPKCGGEVVDTYQRIVGFMTPTRSYSTPRNQEFETRKWFDFTE